MSDDALLREILAEVRELRELVAGRRLLPAERARLERAMPIVHRVTAGAVYASSDLRAYAEAHTADAAALLDAFGSLNDKQIGKLHARAVGCTIAGYRIRRAGYEGGVALWLCSRE